MFTSMPATSFSLRHVECVRMHDMINMCPAAMPKHQREHHNKYMHTLLEIPWRHYVPEIEAILLIK